MKSQKITRGAAQEYAQNRFLPVSMRQDVVRDEPRVEYEITFDGHSVTIPQRLDASGYIRNENGKGNPCTARIVVYESDADKVTGKVEDDPEAIARARRAFEHKFNAWYKQTASGDTEGTEEERRRRYSRIYGETSFEREFQEANLRAIRPLSSARKVAELAPPETPERRDAEARKAQVEIQAEAFSKALQSVIPAIVAALRGEAPKARKGE